jgi:hypothetical protein
VPGGEAGDAFVQQASAMLHERFDIDHVTLQVMRSSVGTVSSS